jgi:hypothetical protein
MISPEKDKAFFLAGLQELEPYLLSKELYWHVSAQTTDFTQLTLGALLLVRERLKGWGASDAKELAMQLDAVRSKWRSAWEEKARREVRARSELWKDFIAARDASARQYPYQVRLRAMLTLLLDDLRENPSEMLMSLDAQLKRKFHAEAFVWDVKLQAYFPQDQFWFLYGNIVTGE